MLGRLIVQGIRRASPEDADASPRFAAGERALLTDTGPDGSRRVATDRALHHHAPGEAEWQSFAWCDVESAGRSPGGPLAVALRGGLVLRLGLSAASRLPSVVAERVTACRLLVRQVTLPTGGTAVVRATRAHPGAVVVWTVEASSPVGERDLADTLAAMRSLIGC